MNPGRESAALAIADATYGIGFGSYGDRRPGMKPLAIAAKPGAPYASVRPEDVYSGAYPLGRHLYFHVNRAPEEALDPSLVRFIRYALSDEAQAVVEETGFLRVPRSLVDETLSSRLLAGR